MSWHTAWSGLLEKITSRDRMDEFWEKLNRDISEYDFVAMGVVADDGTSFTYSVGFWGVLDHPEILIVGIPPSVATQFLWILHDRIADGERFVPGERYEEIMAKFPVEFREIPPPFKPLNVASSLYDGEFEALQLIFPDPDGKFPGEDGFSEQFGEVQLIADGTWD